MPVMKGLRFCISEQYRGRGPLLPWHCHNTWERVFLLGECNTFTVL